MKKEISEFCKENGIEIPTTKKWGMSDTYIEIYNKYEHEIKKWKSTGADGTVTNHALLLYEEEDLKEYFGVKNDS